MWDKMLAVVADVVTTQERLKRLERNVEDLTDEVDDLDARLIRVETIVDLMGGGAPPPRPRRLRRS